MDTVTGGGSYKIGENVTLTATPNRGYRFVEWQDISGKKVRENASYTITKVMTGQTLIAAFQPVGKTVVTIPTITNATYNNTEYVGVATGANYTLAGTTKATDTGAYTVTATLNGEIPSGLTARLNPRRWCGISSRQRRKVRPRRLVPPMTPSSA